MNESDLLAVVANLVGHHPQHAQLVRVARWRLQRVAERKGEPVQEIAEFALTQASAVMQSAKVFNDEERKARAARMTAAIVLVVPGETHAEGLQRIGKANASHQTIHRYASALSGAIEKKLEMERPHDAQDGELFASLGLYLLCCGLSPAEMSDEQLADHLAMGELPKGCDTKLMKIQAKHDLQLDAAECIKHGAMLLDPGTRREWKGVFKKDMLPKLKLPSGGWVGAKQALARFRENHPQFELDLPKGDSFGVSYSEMKREYDGRAIKPRNNAAREP